MVSKEELHDMGLDVSCQHDIKIGQDCKDCEVAPFCKRKWSDGTKNSCMFEYPYGQKDQGRFCLYCGDKEKK